MLNPKKSGLLKITIYSFFIVWFCWTLFAQDNNNQLWNRAIDISTNNKYWIPGRIVDEETILNKNGEIEETTQRVMKIASNECEIPKIELLKTILNDIDITEKARKEFNDYKLKYLEKDDSESPFETCLQDSINYSTTGESENIDSVDCLVYNYRHCSDGLVWYGKAWLDSLTGIPVKLHITTSDKLKEGGTEITDFECDIHYNHNDIDKWYPLRYEYKMNVKIKKFPFYSFVGTIKNSIVLSDYFRYQGK